MAPAAGVHRCGVQASIVGVLGATARCLFGVACASFVAGCASLVARPLPSREAAAGGSTVRIDHFKHDRLALAVRGPGHVTAVGVEPAGPAPIAACVSATGAALELGAEVHGVSAAPGETLVEARFPRQPFTQALAEPSLVAVQLDGAAPACARLTLSSPAPGYRWSFPSYEHHLQVGGAMTFYAARADGRRWGGGLEWELSHLGRWLGPIRATFALRTRIGSDALAVPLGAMLLAYPLVGERIALGVAAGYDLTPAWSRRFEDGDRFKWTHGPRAELHLAYLGPQLLGLPPVYQTGGAALVLWVSRADADHYQAAQLGLGFAIN